MNKTNHSKRKCYLDEKIHVDLYSSKCYISFPSLHRHNNHGYYYYYYYSFFSFYYCHWYYYYYYCLDYNLFLLLYSTLHSLSNIILASKITCGIANHVHIFTSAFWNLQLLSCFWCQISGWHRYKMVDSYSRSLFKHREQVGMSFPTNLYSVIKWYTCTYNNYIYIFYINKYIWTLLFECVCLYTVVTLDIYI